MIQNDFALGVVDIIKSDSDVIGLAVSGSWLSHELDEFSDLDLTLVTTQRISNDRDLMVYYASRFGKLLNAFTGEHVGEPRLLICLYDEPLLHVDIKFLALEELTGLPEEPHVLYDPLHKLEDVFKKEHATWPFPGYQWMEDRFWIWVHYAASKMGRGEYFEALEFLSFLRVQVLSPLLLIKNNKLPKGVRKVESRLAKKDLAKLRSTIARYEPQHLLQCLWNSIKLYQELRFELYPEAVALREATEEKTVAYLESIELGMISGS